MYITLSTEQAVDICMDHKVFGEGQYEATRALVEYFEMLEEEGVKGLGLDPVALRCAFSIYTLGECAEVWDIDTSGVEEEDRSEFILDYLQDRTTVIKVDADTYIVEEF